MVFRSYNPHQRYKERAAHRFASLLAYVAVILISGLIGFWLGKQYAGEQLIMASSKVEVLEKAVSEQREKIMELGAVAETSTLQFQRLQSRVDETAPEGEALILLKLIEEQIEKGMQPKRIEQLIKSGRPPTDCKEPKTRRFVVETKLYKGPKSTVNIEDGLIEIGGKGLPAKSKEGKEEVWYDAARNVEISFLAEEKTTTKRGVMPLYHTLIVADREYRFTIEPGAQSFIKVIYDSCAYP